jgi:predicted metal-dependent hydrolase
MFSFFRKSGAKSAAARALREAREKNPTQTMSFMNREVQIRRKPYRRSIGLTLQANGRIRVSAPSTLPLSKIERFLVDHTAWIEANLKKYETLRDSYPKKEYRSGEKFRFLGQELELCYERGAHSRARCRLQKAYLVVEIPGELWSGFDPHARHPEMADVVSRFYSQQGKKLLAARIDHFSGQMGLAPSSVSFRSQKTRWGSCSSRGRISMNWRLIFAPPEVIDYVVVHELAHLQHYDHSKSFWALVGTQIPDYPRLRQWLRDHQYEADFLAKLSELHPESGALSRQK